MFSVKTLEKQLVREKKAREVGQISKSIKEQNNRAPVLKKSSLIQNPMQPFSLKLKKS